MRVTRLSEWTTRHTFWLWLNIIIWSLNLLFAMMLGEPAFNLFTR